MLRDLQDYWYLTREPHSDCYWWRGDSSRCSETVIKLGRWVLYLSIPRRGRR